MGDDEHDVGGLGGSSSTLSISLGRRPSAHTGKEGCRQPSYDDELERSEPIDGCRQSRLPESNGRGMRSSTFIIHMLFLCQSWRRAWIWRWALP